MRLKIVLPAFAVLLVISTATSFIGYRYLGLASEYRERNFLHLSATTRLLDSLQAAPVMRLDDISEIKHALTVTNTQANWCLEVLNDFEKWVFARLGAGGALQLCADDIKKNEDAYALIDTLEAAFTSTGEPHKYSFAMNLKLQSIGQQILRDSRDFHPYVSIIEDRVSQVVHVGTIFTALGLAIAFFLLGRDLVKSHRIQALQTEELSELAAVAERAHDSIILADTAGRITWINPAFESLSGYSMQEALGKKPGEILQGPDTNAQTTIEIGTALRERRPIKREILNYTKFGEPYWIALSISALENTAGEHYGFVAISSDISKQVEQREVIDAVNREIEHKSLHDALTDLPNRRALDDAMRERIMKTIPTTLVRIDLDHFKYVNDTLGHEAGDFVLEQVGDILRAETREEDLPVRVGGDEFVVLLSGGKTTEHGRILAERVLSKIKQPMLFQGKQIRVGGSFGVASTLDGLLTVEELIIGADAALYEAKENGRNRVNLYTAQLHSEIDSRRLMARELKKAVAEEEFVPYFQPQVDARSRNLIGVEALARWPSDTLGFVTPDEFLPVAYRLSIVEEIDDIIFRKAIKQVQEIHDLGVGIDKVALNVTAHRIQDPNVVRLIQQANTGTLKIAFEVLESVLIEDQTDRFQFGIDSLREAGVAIEVDDFGSGHASVVGLMQLKPDAMKIDRRLIESISERATNRKVVASIVEIAKNMELTTIAEGVETLEQAAILTDIGCDILQGYAFAKPMPANELKSFAEMHSQRRTA